MQGCFKGYYCLFLPNESSFCIAQATSHLFEEGSVLLIAACSVCTEDIGCKSESYCSVCSFLPCYLSIALSLHTCIALSPQRKSGGRKTGSDLDMKYATQSMEYEVSTMKSAGKRGERTKEFAESLLALIRHSQGSGPGRHRCASGKLAAYMDVVDYHDYCLCNSTSRCPEHSWQVTQFIALLPAEHVTRDQADPTPFTALSPYRPATAEVQCSAQHHWR